MSPEVYGTPVHTLDRGIRPWYNRGMLSDQHTQALRRLTQAKHLSRQAERLARVQGDWAQAKHLSRQVEVLAQRVQQVERAIKASG